MAISFKLFLIENLQPKSRIILHGFVGTRKLVASFEN